IAHERQAPSGGGQQRGRRGYIVADSQRSCPCGRGADHQTDNDGQICHPLLHYLLSLLEPDSVETPLPLSVPESIKADRGGRTVIALLQIPRPYLRRKTDCRPAVMLLLLPKWVWDTAPTYWGVRIKDGKGVRCIEQLTHHFLMQRCGSMDASVSCKLANLTFS